MKDIFNPLHVEEILNRIDQLNPNSKPQWGKGIYKHLDHHLKQFGV